jgi:hypothetical protein
MRNRSFLAVLSLTVLVPAALAAQRPRLGTRVRPAALPPMAPTVARELNYAYRRIAFSTESYPMINVVSAAGFLAEGSTSHWTSYGVGQRLSLRLKPYVFGTLDLTTAPFGGLTTTNTVELGARVTPDVWDHRLHPYADIRAGYMFAYEGFGINNNDGIANPATVGMRGSRYSEGFGGIAGAGVSMSLTRTIMATLGASYMQNRMTNHRISEATTGNGPDYYRITSYRYTLGLRWNPVKTIVSDPTGDRR